MVYFIAVLICATNILYGKQCFKLFLLATKPCTEYFDIIHDILYCMFMRIALGYCNSTNILEWPTGILVLVAAAAAAAGTTEAASRQHCQYIALCLNFS